jgi:DNA-binding NtrC family response regulator
MDEAGRSPKPRVLLIEDDPSGREVARYNLVKEGYEVTVADDGEAGIERFDAARHALVITDVKMPGVSGMDVLQAVKETAPNTPVIVVTAFGNVQLAVEAMKAGAEDFIGKPFNRDQLLLAVRRALDARGLREEVRALRRRVKGTERPIVSRSQAMTRLLDVVDRVAVSEATVLITGESGTGKELIARRLHARSARADGPFVAVNAAAIPDQLLESELFGHERGAFTGADRAREGRFRQARGGTIFLDEIAEIPLALQAKLLRVLQERVVDVVGGERPVPVDVRVVAATNRDLQAEVAAGRFREDLFYRLNVVEVSIPPLRERPEDIEPLARHFVTQIAGGRDLACPRPLIDELRARSWPGNVRELENACERAVVLCAGDTLSLEDLPRRASTPDPAGTEVWPELPLDGLSLIDLEKRVIERVLRMQSGNVSKSARYLGIPRHVLIYRMEKYGVRREPPR